MVPLDHFTLKIPYFRNAKKKAEFSIKIWSVINFLVLWGTVIPLLYCITSDTDKCALHRAGDEDSLESETRDLRPLYIIVVVVMYLIQWVDVFMLLRQHTNNDITQEIEHDKLLNKANRV